MLGKFILHSLSRLLLIILNLRNSLFLNKSMSIKFCRLRAPSMYIVQLSGHTILIFAERASHFLHNTCSSDAVTGANNEQSGEPIIWYSLIVKTVAGPPIPSLLNRLNEVLGFSKVVTLKVKICRKLCIMSSGHKNPTLLKLL